MSFFGMGAWEITIILVAALVIFGPDRLPEMAGKVGKQIRDLRQMSTDLTGEFERSAGVQEFKSAVQGEISGVKSQVNSVTSSVKRDLDKAGSKVSTTAKAATTSSTSKVSGAKTTTSTTSKTTTAKSTTTAKKEPPKATKKDPLADLAFFDEPTGPAKPATSPTVAKPSVTGTVKSSSSTTKASAATSEDHIDALARARQRRQAAGYNRRPS
jgi:Tat protein translocase TatB subunit